MAAWSSFGWSHLTEVGVIREELTPLYECEEVVAEDRVDEDDKREHCVVMGNAVSSKQSVVSSEQ